MSANETEMSADEIIGKVFENGFLDELRKTDEQQSLLDTLTLKHHPKNFCKGSKFKTLNGKVLTVHCIGAIMFKEDFGYLPNQTTSGEYTFSVIAEEDKNSYPTVSIQGF